MQLLLSSLSAGILLLSAMMQINTALALSPDLSVTSLLWGAVEQGLAAASTSLIFSIAHLAWTVGYVTSKHSQTSHIQQTNHTKQHLFCPPGAALHPSSFRAAPAHHARASASLFPDTCAGATVCV